MDVLSGTRTKKDPPQRGLALALPIGVESPIPETVEEMDMRVSAFVRTAFVAIGIAALAACSEAPTSPTMTESDEASFAKGGVARPDSGQASFWYYPQYGVWGSLGPHSLVIPAHSICEPSSTRYGPEYWDAPCMVATRPVRITARWFLVGNETRISFSPDMRFVPTNDRDRWVTLSMRQERGTVSNETTILWWDQLRRAWIDEAANDPTLAPWVDRGGNRVTRRVKHFSGYVIGTFCRTDCGGSGEGL